MTERGLGEYQVRKARRSREAILTILSDNEPHRYNEIVEKTKLSTATVSKILKKLEKERKIKKKIDVKSGEYPYPVYYKLLSDGARTLTLLRQINFMDNSFIQTLWPQEWIEEALSELINEAYKKKFGRFERLTRSKEDRFFYEVLKKEVLKERVSETNLAILHKGLLPFRMNEGMVKVTIQLMLDLFIDIVNARKDDEEPVVMVLSYLPTIPRVQEKEKFFKETFEHFVSWAKELKHIEVNSVPQNEIKRLQAEYLQKYKKYHNSLRTRVLEG